jgi:diguanylate cyclase (GGDEF)-like protein
MPRSRDRIRVGARVACVLALSLAAIAAIVALQQRATASGEARVRVAQLKNYLNQALAASWNANADVGGNPVIARRKLSEGEQNASRTLAQLRREAPLRVLDQAPPLLQAEYTIDEQIYGLGSATGYGTWIDPLMVPQNDAIDRLFSLLDRAGRQYAGDADRAHTLGTIGTAAAILLLAAAFLAMYRRAYRLAAVNRHDALTDALTGLPNRRALLAALQGALPAADAGHPLTLAMFDLDGFKSYNDAFGHAAGDALLTRLARALRDACGARATAYRLGGDEFCLLAPDIDAGARALLLADAESALSGSGETWTIGCSGGAVVLPEETQSASEALALADVRMYSTKRGRSSAARQTTDALLCLLDQRSPDVSSRIDNVAALANATALAMHLDEALLRDISWAAELHDVGKAAIPDGILTKPGPLDREEWKLVQRHTLLGERIMLAAPALAGAAKLVRSSHERIDGTGYPDGLRGEAIPLGSRVIFVCDAFDAMISRRPYRAPMLVDEALAELRRCAGAQFDSRVVEAFIAVVLGRAVASGQVAA